MSDVFGKSATAITVISKIGVDMAQFGSSNAIYSMPSTGEIWNPVDLFKVDMPKHLKERQLQKAVKQAVRFLKMQGLKVS